MADCILVTGGAGYIGSHMVLRLIDAGYRVVVLDNLYSGHGWAVHEKAVFYQGAIQDQRLVGKIISDHRVDAVVHFAGHIVVPESVENPGKYYTNNVLGSLSLIQTCIDRGVNRFVFSSSAAVYGVPDDPVVSETSELRPINPYGTTKLMTEWTLRDFSHAARGAFKYVALRYFNVAGAHIGGRLGQATANAAHLIKVACEAACGVRPDMSIFGDDYDTYDGSCIRDYIHVDDLTAAHVDALVYLKGDGDNQILNCGYGNGYSVKDVIECVKSVSNRDFAVHVAARRAGDPPHLIANSDRIKQLFNWKPRYNNLTTICESAYRWERRLQENNPADESGRI